MTELHLGTLAHVTGNPFVRDGVLQIIARGALAVAAGRILAVGEAETLRAAHPKASVVDHGSGWLLPGMVDGHIHFPQYYATAAPGEQLLDWLDQSIFPAELKLADPNFARECAQAFVAHLLRAGTTTALVFGSQFRHATQALFEEAEAQGLRLLSGPTLMDRNGPDGLMTPPATAADDCEHFINWCATRERSHFALTPRFALSCSPELFDVCVQLQKQHDDLYVQTHINESYGEIETVVQSFSEHRHYLDVYDRAGLVGERTVLAHGIYCRPDELDLLAARDAVVCHCPTSNLYLGSGLFPMKHYVDRQIRFMMGTDVGAGTQFSILEELGSAYKVQQMKRFGLNAAKLLYLGTLGGAQALSLGHRVGNFVVGKDADFFVLDPSRDEYLQARLLHCEDDVSRLFVLLNLARESAVASTYTGA